MKKTALITGGSRGIGLGIARALAEEGFDLAINGVRDESSVQDVIQSLEASGSEVIYCQGDVSQPEARDHILDRVKQKLGHLNMLVNNAGIPPKERKDILETTEESFDQVLKTNLYGPYFLTQKAANRMIECKKSDPRFFASIVNIGSFSATVASVNRGEYCISKAGMAMITSLFAVRLAEHEIPVYEVRPGIIKTDMTAKVQDKYDKLIGEGLVPQLRWGEPKDIGKVVRALARGDFPYSTGEVIMVDGGFTIQRL
jgi:NAD(P)-dependent dehydrogenase (short-subunit alcohol dehydrogenase family)